MKFSSHRLRVGPTTTAGSTVTDFLETRPRLGFDEHFVAVVPAMISYFGTMPKRYEVTELVVILRQDH